MPNYSEVRKKLSQLASEAIKGKQAKAEPALPEEEGMAPAVEEPVSKAIAIPDTTQAAEPLAPQPIPLSGDMNERLAQSFLSSLQGLVGLGTGGYEGYARAQAQSKDEREHALKLKEKDYDKAIKQAEVDAKRLDAELKKTEKVTDQEFKLREEFSKNPQIKTAAESGQSLQVLQELRDRSEKDPDAIRDVSLVYNFVKALDPGSTVRESEADLVEKAKGVLAAVPGLWERFKSGQKLLPEQRDQMVKAASDAYTGRVNNVSPIVNQYRKLSEKYGVEVDSVTGHMGFGKPAPAPTPAVTPNEGTPAATGTKKSGAAPAEVLKSIGISQKQLSDFAKREKLTEEQALRALQNRAARGR